MKNGNKMDIDLYGIGKALYNMTLAVPIYQRSYAWEQDHVLELFDDIKQAIEQREQEYFLGSIVTTKNSEARPEVADGQQRLATITILLAAIRDHFYDSGDSERAETITSEYLYKKDLATLNRIPKLKLNDLDNEFFEKRVLSEPDSEERAIPTTRLSHERISETALLAKQHVSKIAEQSSPTGHLTNLVQYIKESVMVIWVKASDDSNAFTIFETLNDRGIALAISDLLKNYLFGISSEKLTEIQQRWQSVIGTFETMDQPELILLFIRQFWSSKHGLIREKNLYKHIKKRVRNKDQALAFATELDRNAKLYSAILNTKHDIWQRYGPTARQHMDTLNTLRMVQIRPLVLAVMDKFCESEVQKSLKLILSWAVRFLITGSLGSGTLEIHYSRSAKDVRDGKITSAEKLRIDSKQVVPTDGEFKNAFASASVSKPYLARYYLMALEKEARGDPEPELVPNDNAEVVNLEHILPKSPSANWKIGGDEHAALYRRIGNLALTKKRINVTAGNNSFAFKKPFYRKSDYILTSSIASVKEWNEKSINSRQEKLSKLALKAWPLK